jgi:deoxyribodipyrimidine photo-lyase
MRGLIWFKKDLRISDQLALHNACQHAIDGVIGLYIIDVNMWNKHHVSHCQIEFILRGLQKLQIDLEAIGIPLIIKQIDKTEQIPAYLLALTHEHKISTVFFNREYEVNEKKRDAQVAETLTNNNVKIAAFDDQLIIPANLTLKSNSEYFKVFTPFKRNWQNVFTQNKKLTLLPKPKLANVIKLSSDSIPTKLDGIQSSIDPALWPAGETAARKNLRAFSKENLFYYDTQRDFPALDKTSKLSAYLALGMISPRECFLTALDQNHHELDSGNKGALTWMSELIWREFYRSILIEVPRICMNKAYQEFTDDLPWRYNEPLLESWQQGKTGFPIVDAAMRQLNTTGWMHNRLRMVVAMFLSKNLFLDWRLGEKYFSEKLIDIDFASNNGGWQWSASTGTDAVPYFRLFNPTTQSERFDPEGKFIRQYCPELQGFSNKEIHNPYEKNPNLAIQCHYTKPVIDYKLSRVRILEAFKKLHLTTTSNK